MTVVSMQQTGEVLLYFTPEENSSRMYFWCIIFFLNTETLNTLSLLEVPNLDFCLPISQDQN